MVESDEVSEGVSIRCICTNKIEEVNYNLNIKQHRCSTYIGRLGSIYCHMLPFYYKIKHRDNIVKLHLEGKETKKIAGNRKKVKDTFVRKLPEIIRVLRLQDKLTAHLLIEG